MTEPQDPIGYNVYRSDDPDLPKDQWTRLTEEPIPDTKFKDRGLQPGTRYYYYVTAVYPGGLESGPSKVSSCVAPGDVWPDIIGE
ncbi:MAG: hypothetical protein DMF68_17330 [Acidobacteria bacterium]|nr:MAG: hypothetical protein DMF68_17330 [Acidobacteriota bacterium]